MVTLQAKKKKIGGGGAKAKRLAREAKALAAAQGGGDGQDVDMDAPNPPAEADDDESEEESEDDEKVRSPPSRCSVAVLTQIHSCGFGRSAERQVWMSNRGSGLDMIPRWYPHSFDTTP